MADTGLRKSGVILVADQFEDYMRKMQQIQKAHEAAFGSGSSANFQKAQEGVRNQVSQTGKEVDNLKGKVGQLGGGGVSGALNNLMNAFGGIKSAVLGVVAALGLYKAVQFVEESAKIAMRNQELAVVLNVVGKNLGYTKEQMDAGVEVLKKTGITTSAATDSLIKMAQAEIEWTKAAQLARIAQDAAVIGETNSSEAFQRMIWGIKSGQIEILKTLGLNVNFEASYRKMADSLHTTTGALNEQQKIQARVNAVVEEGRKIAGTYEAAMGTAGKQQRTIARYVEETQANLGKLLLPWEEFKVSVETASWKNFQRISEILVTWEPMIRNAIGALSDFMGMSKTEAGKVKGETKQGPFDVLAMSVLSAVGRAIPGVELQGGGRFAQLAEGESIMDRLQRSLYDLKKGIPILQAAIAGFAVAISGYFSNIGDAFNLHVLLPFQVLQGAITGNTELVARASEEMTALADKKPLDIWTLSQEAYAASLKKSLELYPQLTMSYEDFVAAQEAAAAAAANIDLTPQLTPAQKYIAAQQDIIKGLQVQQQVLAQVNKVWEQYNKTLENAAKSRDKALLQADEQLNKSIAKLQESAGKQLASIEVNAQKARQKAIQDANRAIVEQQRAHNREMDNERKRFELSQTQALREFKNQEKWLMAEGDVIALMQLRDNYDIQQQNAQENNALSASEQEQAFQDSLQANQRQLQERMQEIETSLAEQRQTAADSYNEQLADMVTANEERKAAIVEAYGEQIQAAKDARDQQLTDLGKALQDETTMTEQGIKGIADVMATLFGEAGAGDALIKGWADRSTTAVDVAMEAIKKQIADIETMIARVEAGGVVPGTPSYTPYQGPPASYGTVPQYGPWSPSYPAKSMRQGGVGVVTGPALFAIEPGQREAYAFAPVGGRASNLNVNALVSGGIDIRGAEGASAGVVDTAVTTTMRELQEAIKRIGKR